MVINKFVIIEITENQFNDNIEVDFSIDYNCTHGFNSYIEAKKKMDALYERYDRDHKKKWGSILDDPQLDETEIITDRN